MNILFVNYGDFTTNSLNHIGGFANTLCASGHACVVVVPTGKNTVAHLRDPLFVAATYEEALGQPGLFPDSRPADLIHAWTPREGVRKFVLAYQRAIATPARVLIHLEDNERYLLECYTGQTYAALQEPSLAGTGTWLIDVLPDPLRHEGFLRIADGVTHIVDRLREFVPAGTPTHLLTPGVDFTLYRPQPADGHLRAELGLQENERIIVFTGSNTFANEPEMRELYLAVALLNQRGTPTRLVRTGFNSPEFLASLAFDHGKYVLDLGFIDKARLPHLLALADVLVQPGRPGPFNDYRLPSKLPEFLAMGKPVVLPPTNLALLLHDHQEAVFLKTGAPEEIVETCLQLFADPALCASLGANGAAFARSHFDLVTNTRRLAAFYAATLARPPTTHWSLATDPFATEVTLLAARAESLASQSGEVDAVLAADLALLARLVRQLELSLGSGRNQALDLEGERLANEQHIRNLQEGLRLTQSHAGNLERAHAEVQAHAGNLERAHAEVQAHAGNLERALAEVQAHAGNLERMLADLRPRFDQADRLRHRAETLLKAARQQIGAFENEIERLETTWQQRLNLAETNFRQSDREAQYYKKLLHQHYAESQAFNEAARTRHAELQALNGELARRDEKLRHIQASFSWWATAWLRLLRRKLVDPFVRRPTLAATAPQTARPGPDRLMTAPALTFRYIVDYPQAWSFPAKKLLVRGWCLAPELSMKQLRATVNGCRRYPGVYGLKRLDVFASMRNVPQAEYCGWKVEIPLENEDHELVLEIGDDEGGWHIFFTTPLRVGNDTGPAELTSYERWTETFDRHTPESLAALAKDESAFALKPLISIVMPVYNTPQRWLLKAVASVQAQVYPRWELCIADDASPQTHLRPLLEKLAAGDARIKVCFREKNGHISAASNSALELATGEYIALLDHDDELAPNALHEVVALLNVHLDTDLVYSDEDKIDEEGHRHEPYFKPDWLPDLFHAQNYLSHLTVHRTTMVRDVGGFRIGYEGSQDWDLALRVVARITDPSRIRHIPKVLYHWRAIPGSTALMLSEKNYPLEAARRALTDHFATRGEKVTLHHVPGDHWRVQYPLPPAPPLVSLVIPTRNGLRFLQRCVDSILEKTTYPNYELIIVDNGSDDPATLAYLQSLADGTHPLQAGVAADSMRSTGTRLDRTVRVLHYDAPFNFSAINNFAVAQATGELIGLLNNDLEVIHGGWLDEMAAQALRPDVGCVGAILYYPNDTIQHAGVIVGLGGVAGHAFRDYPRGSDGNFNRARLVQNYSAVTAACLVVRREIYLRVGGLDEQNLTVAFNDIDFCLKVQAAGHRNLWTPFAELYHHESVSRGAEDTPEKHERFRREVETMLQRWPAVIRHDPAYNPNLTLEHTDFSLAAPPRPWMP